MAQYEIDLGRFDDCKVSERVVAAVADVRDEHPLELPRLYEVIDPDALDQLFDSGVAGGQTGPSRMSFMHADCEVVVHSDGEVDVTAPDERMEASSVAHPAVQDQAESRLD